MTTISWSRFRRSARYAVRGLGHAWRTENNFRIHTFVGLLVFVGMVFIPLSWLERAVLVLVITTILNLELVNTIVERFVGLLEPRIHPYVGVIKDLMAAAILLSATGAVIIGAMIFGPHIWR